MEDSIEFLRVGPEDWVAFREIRLLALRSDPGAFGSTFEREAEFEEATWRERLKNFTILARSEKGSHGIGSLYPVKPGWFRVVSMWTDPELRGQGVGHGVLVRLLEHADAQGANCNLDVVEDNPAQRLYARHGFKPNGHREELRTGQGVFAIEMERILQKVRNS